MAIKVKRGDIIWLKDNVPCNEFGGSVQSLERPYVVISNNINNRRCPTVNVASVSKAINKVDFPMHVYLCKEKYKLQYDSVIFTEQVKTVPKSYIKTVASTLDKQDIKKLNRAIYVQMIDEGVCLDVI